MLTHLADCLDHVPFFLKGEEHRSDLQGEIDKPDSAEQQREQDELEAKYAFWSIFGSFISRTRVEERQKMHVPQDISLPIPLK